MKTNSIAFFSFVIVIIFSQMCSAGEILKPSTNHPVYLAAVINIGPISDIGAIQVEFAKQNYAVLRSRNPLEVSHKPQQFYSPDFILQIYDNGNIVYFGFGKSHEPGTFVYELSEMFTEGQIKNEFFAALSASGQISFQQIKYIKEIANWRFYAMNESIWALGRVYVNAGSSPSLTAFTEEQPEFAWFRFMWNLEVNGIRVENSSKENYARLLRKGKNFLLLPLSGQASSRFFYFFLDGSPRVTTDVKRFDVVQFKTAYIGQLWR